MCCRRVGNKEKGRGGDEAADRDASAARGAVGGRQGGPGFRA